jgi:hypothetical protein
MRYVPSCRHVSATDFLPGQNGSGMCYELIMAADISDDLTGSMPIVPHETTGVDCCGCIVAAVDGNNVELRCNECGAVVGVIQIDILRGLLGIECATAKCPHCGTLNKFPGFSEMLAYTCRGCGKLADFINR